MGLLGVHSGLQGLGFQHSHSDMPGRGGLGLQGLGVRVSGFGV